MTKNEQISKSLSETRVKRQAQQCKVYTFKIDISKCNSNQLEKLKMYFVEAKWLYNHFLNKGKIFSQDYKIQTIEKYNKNKQLETQTLNHLPAKSKQIILQELKQNIYNLSKRKKKDFKIGKLRFKSDFNSLDFNQYGNSHKIVNSKRFKLQGIKKPLPIHGLNQLDGDEDLASCKLIKKPSGYYIKLTTFKYKKPFEIKTALGLDFGIKNNITTSEGKTHNICVEETGRLKVLQAKLAIKQKGSNNRYKIRQKIQREYEKMYNRKKDQVNKIVSKLSDYTLFMQDENLDGWKSGYFGKQVQYSGLGLLKAKLKEKMFM